MASLIRHLAFWSAVPFVALQALGVRRSATRLPAPSGERHGVAPGRGRPLRVVGVGDSIIDGVGADTPAQALTGALAAALARRASVPVEWRAVGESGLTAAQVRAKLAPAALAETFDVAAVSVGVNDVTGLTRTRDYRRELEALVEALHARAPGAVVAVLGVPPMDRFPLLPRPLRGVLGLRSRLLNDVAASVVAARSWAVHLSAEFDDPRWSFCADGYHPSSTGYAAMGDAIAERVIPLLPPR